MKKWRKIFVSYAAFVAMAVFANHCLIKGACNITSFLKDQSYQRDAADKESSNNNNHSNCHGSTDAQGNNNEKSDNEGCCDKSCCAPLLSAKAEAGLLEAPYLLQDWSFLQSAGVSYQVSVHNAFLNLNLSTTGPPAGLQLLLISHSSVPNAPPYTLI